MLKITLDNREQELLKLFPDTEVQQLDIGDIHYIDNEENIHTIIERKTLNDLSSSIIDGRYKEQKSRLLASNKNIIYLLEGNKNGYGVKYSTILSCMLNLQLRDNIKVIRTKDIKETASVLILLKEKLLLEGNTENKIEYESTIHISKKQNLTKDMVFIHQLSCIPGISTKTAKLIANKYKNMFDLTRCFANEGENMLTTINGIGSTISNKIYYYINND